MNEQERRQARALELAKQCAGEHVVAVHPVVKIDGELITSDVPLICYCIRDMGHDGKHLDCFGDEFEVLFPWIGRWERHMTMVRTKSGAVDDSCGLCMETGEQSEPCQGTTQPKA